MPAAENGRKVQRASPRAPRPAAHEPGVTKLLQARILRYFDGAVRPARHAGSPVSKVPDRSARTAPPSACPISIRPSTSRMNRPRHQAGTSPVVAGSLIVASIILCAAIGFGVGALVGLAVPLGIVGLFAGV